MNSLVDHEQIYAARKADLSDWILNNHPEDVIREGSKSLRLVADPSVNIGMGFSGYKDFSTGEKGNPIDFLMNYYDYDFMEAVGELSNTHFSCPSPSLSATRLSPSVEKKKGFHNSFCMKFMFFFIKLVILPSHENHPGQKKNQATSYKNLNRI